MAWWSISLFLLSVTYLTYQHPPATWTRLPQWMRPAKRRTIDDTDDARDQSRLPTPKETNEEIKGEKEELVQETDHTKTVEPDLPPAPVLIQASLDEENEGDKTPQAKPTPAPAAVPSFTLDDSHTTEGDDEEEDERDNLPPPMFPAINSAQRANKVTRSANPSPSLSTTISSPSPGMMPPPPKPSSGSGMLPPPSVPASSLMPPPRGPPIRTSPSRPSTLGVPSKGPVPNRGGGLAPPPSAASQARGGLAPSRIDTPNSRNKVQLTPGHSPLDWATLSRSKNLSGVPSFMRVTPSMLKHFNGRKDKATGEKKDAWSVFHAKVYNISPYLKFHPGGEGELLRAAGKDGTQMFLEVHPWVNWEGMMGSCLVGVMVGEEEGGEGLEGLD